MKISRRARKGKEQKRFEALLAALPEGEGARVQRLEARRQQIETAAPPLLHDEVDKLKDLVMAFAEIAVATDRWQRHLIACDPEGLESELRFYETAKGAAIDDDQRELARQNHALLEERKANLVEVKRRLARARAELDLVENSVRLIADQVAAMTGPDARGALAERIADLVVGVEAVREMTED